MIAAPHSSVSLATVHPPLAAQPAFARAFSGRSVFVTGHTGFKGSWLCHWLHRLGARVSGYALAPPTEPNHFTISSVERLLANHWEADIRNEATLLSAMNTAEPEIVIHLAAQSVVRRSYQIPRETFDVNVMGTISVLECIRRRGKPCVVVSITSDKCYENREQAWGYRESDALGERDPYGASKGAAELAIRAYRESYFHPAHYEEHRVKLASARAGNVIGGGDFTPDALVVDIAKAVSRGQPASIRNPGAFRPWQHVLEALSGYLTLAARLWESDEPELCSGWNFGPLPGSELPVRDVVELFHREYGSGTWIDASDSRQPHESITLRLAIDKAIWRLGWKPRWNVERAIAETARWYRAYFDGADVVALLQSQLAAYEQTIPGRTASAPVVLNAVLAGA